MMKIIKETMLLHKLKNSFHVVTGSQNQDSKVA